MKYLQQFTPGRQFGPREIPPQHYWYGQYYAALAMWTAGDDYWTAVATRPFAMSCSRGPAPAAGRGPILTTAATYATAMALIVLQLPNNYLPILQK